MDSKVELVGKSAWGVTDHGRLVELRVSSVEIIDSEVLAETELVSTGTYSEAHHRINFSRFWVDDGQPYSSSIFWDKQRAIEHAKCLINKKIAKLEIETRTYKYNLRELEEL